MMGIFQYTASRFPLIDIGTLTDGPARLVARLDAALSHLEVIATGFAAMRNDVAGMRAGVEALSEQVDGLRSRRARVAREHRRDPDSMASMDGRIEELARTLVAIDLIAARFSRFGVRRRAAARSTTRPSSRRPARSRSPAAAPVHRLARPSVASDDADVHHMGWMRTQQLTNHPTATGCTCERTDFFNAGTRRRSQRSSRWWRLTAAALIPAAPAGAATSTASFSYTGSEQTWVVPEGVGAVLVTAIGAAGGNGVSGGPAEGRLGHLHGERDAGTGAVHRGRWHRGERLR